MWFHHTEHHNSKQMVWYCTYIEEKCVNILEQFTVGIRANVCGKFVRKAFKLEGSGATQQNRIIDTGNQVKDHIDFRFCVFLLYLLKHNLQREGIITSYKGKNMSQIR